MQTKKRFHHLMLLVPPAEARQWHAVARREDLRLSQFIRRLVRERVAQITEPAPEPARRQGVTLSTLVRQAVGERPAGTSAKCPTCGTRSSATTGLACAACGVHELGIHRGLSDHVLRARRIGVCVRDPRLRQRIG